MLAQMRPKLLHPTRQRSHERRERRNPRRAQVSPPPVALAATRACDPAVARVREAGGPIDNASYSCGCGYVFRASVSTTVSCPHCGAGQAW
jgi:hypothetical protein